MRLETERLVLREWRDADRPIYARYNADPIVRRFYKATLTPAETNELIDRFVAETAQDGFGFMVVERKSDGAMLGDVGISRMGPILVDVLRGHPEVEIGWLLGKEHWGQGYCPEAARACLDYAFGVLGLPEIVAFTSTANRPSMRVMEKIGMLRDPDGDFDNPFVPEGHPLRPHVLYRIANPL